jgi:hypothetical protein
MSTPIEIPPTNVIDNMYLISLIGNIESTNDSHAYGPKNSHIQCSCGTKSHNNDMDDDDDRTTALVGVVLLLPSPPIAIASDSDKDTVVLLWPWLRSWRH